MSYSTRHAAYFACPAAFAHDAGIEPRYHVQDLINVDSASGGYREWHDAMLRRRDRRLPGHARRNGLDGV